MTAATILGVFLVPVLYVVVERIAGKEKKEAVGIPRTAGTRGRTRLMRKIIAVALLPVLFNGLRGWPQVCAPSNPAPGQLLRPSSRQTANSAADLAWWDLFKDPVLQDLIREALKSNYDLQLAVARVEQEKSLPWRQSFAVLPASGIRRQHFGTAIAFNFQSHVLLLQLQAPFGD